MDRRTFLRTGLAGGVAVGLARRGVAREPSTAEPRAGATGVRILSTHPAGLAVNRRAADVLAEGGTALDAVEAGVRVAEADPDDTSVGYGGFPNAAGVVELDAAIIDGSTLDAGSVAALRDIKHPVSVARMVMDRTPHLMLVGRGAKEFALANGFRKENLLTERARREWKAWKASRSGKKGHDTMGILVLSPDGAMAAACTTSGAAWKLPGRVGDSPLIGQGLYCDGNVGGAAATGLGEEVIKVCGSYQVVEFLRQGVEPAEAVARVLRRILRRRPSMQDEFVGFIALRADGAAAFASTTPGFEAAIFQDGEHHLAGASRVGSG